jgi:hypothetical protein
VKKKQGQLGLFGDQDRVEAPAVPPTEAALRQLDLGAIVRNFDLIAEGEGGIARIRATCL